MESSSILYAYMYEEVLVAWVFQNMEELVGKEEMLLLLLRKVSG